MRLVPYKKRYQTVHSISEKVVLCGQSSQQNQHCHHLDLTLSASKTTRNKCLSFKLPDRDIFHSIPFKYQTLTGENQWPCVKFKQRLQVDVRRVTFHPGWKMRDTSLMTSNIPSSQHSNLNRLHVLVHTHIFFSLCNQGWCWPPKEPVHKYQGLQPAHIQPAHTQPPKQNPAKASAHPSYIHIGTSLPTILGPTRPSRRRDNRAEKPPKQSYYYLFPLFVSNLVYVYFPFFTLAIFASDVSMLLFLLSLSKN